MRRLTAGSVLLWLALIAVGAEGSAHRPAPIEVADAWIRWMPGNIPAGGYLTLVNHGDVPVRLIAASSDAYGDISLHQSREQGGVSTMTPVAGVTVGPHSRLELAAAGYHLMLMQPQRALKVGDTVLITLRFAQGAPVRVPFLLRSPDMLRAN